MKIFTFRVKKNSGKTIREENWKNQIWKKKFFFFQIKIFSKFFFSGSNFSIFFLAVGFFRNFFYMEMSKYSKKKFPEKIPRSRAQKHRFVVLSRPKTLICPDAFGNSMLATVRQHFQKIVNWCRTVDKWKMSYTQWPHLAQKVANFGELWAKSPKFAAQRKTEFRYTTQSSGGYSDP